MRAVLLISLFLSVAYSQDTCADIVIITDSATFTEPVTGIIFPVLVYGSNGDAVVIIEGGVEQVFTIPQYVDPYDPNQSTIWVHTQNFEGTRKVTVRYGGCEESAQVNFGRAIYPAGHPTFMRFLYEIGNATNYENMNGTFFEAANTAWKFRKDVFNPETGEACELKRASFSYLNESWEAVISTNERRVFEELLDTQVFKVVSTNPLHTVTGQGRTRYDVELHWDEATEVPEGGAILLAWSVEIDRETGSGIYTYSPPEVLEFLTVVSYQMCFGLETKKTREVCNVPILPGGEMIPTLSCVPGAMHVYGITLLAILGIAVFFIIIALPVYFLVRKKHPEIYHPSYGSGQEGKKSSQEAALDIALEKKGKKHLLAEEDGDIPIESRKGKDSGDSSA